MRKQLLLITFLLLLTAALAAAQESEPGTGTAVPDSIPLDHWPTELFSDNWLSVELEAVDEPTFLPVDNFLPAGNTCGAVTIDVPINGEAGGQTNVSNYTVAATDPNLGSCMWGSPPSQQGHRTAWYRLVAPASGLLIVDSGGSNYDTVIAIHTGSCDSPVRLSCNDDYIGLTSRATANVVQGQVYHIEVVDWRQEAPSGGAHLKLTAGIVSISQWEQIGLMASARTRHIAVAVDHYLYVIGGQAYDTSGGVTRIRDMSRFNTRTQTWETMPSMPHVCGGEGPDSGGYSNTTGVYLNGRIYIPAGFVGEINTYSGAHCMFDTTTNLWYPNQPNVPLDAPWPGGEPYAWSSAVAFPNFNGYFLTGGLSGAMPLTPGLPSPPPDWQPRNEMLFYEAGGTVNNPGQWSTLAPMSTARFAHTAAYQRIGANDYVCVVGGLTKNIDNQPAVLTSGQCYNVNTNSWTITTGPLNIPRYNAGSAVGPDGRWYVFGGSAADGSSVALTEVYDKDSGNWIALDSRYDLDEPPRAWPRGDFIGGSLWITGGDWQTFGGPRVINLIERMFVLHHDLFLPITMKALDGTRPGQTIISALLIQSGQGQAHAFNSASDYIHVFYYDTTAFGTTSVHLSNIPLGSDYNLHVYHSNKGRIASGLNVGNHDEYLGIVGVADRYYIFVERVFPPPGADPHPQPYHLHVNHP